MKNLFYFIFWLLLLFRGGIIAQDTLTIVHVNDTHSTLAPMAPRTDDLKGTRGGIARAAAVIEATKKTEPNVLTLHGGDAMIGDLFYNTTFGIAELRLINALGFDAMALGNHEFDLGPKKLCEAFDSSLTVGGFSIVSSNLILEDPELCRLKSIVKPFLIKEYGKLKVGVFSLLTPGTNLLSSPSPAVVDTGITASITNALTQLTGDGCNVIILISHLGIENDKQLAQLVPGIDIIISSHDHITTVKPLEIDNPSGTKTYIVQAGSNYSHVGKLQLIVDAHGKRKIKYDLIELDKKIPELPEIRDAVDALIAEIEKTYGPVYTAKIAEASGTFYEAAEHLSLPGNHDTPLGNLITDAFRWKTGTQIAIEAGGSLAQPIWKGPVTAADVFRAVGYGFNEVNGLGFRIVKFNMTGAQLYAGLEAGVSMAETDDEMFPQVSGMKFGYDIRNAPFSRILWVTVNDIPLDTAAVYSVTANEFLVQVLQSMFGIEISSPYLYRDSTEFQVLTEYIIMNGTISPKVSGMITPVETAAPVPFSYRMDQNYPNPFNPATTITVSIPAAGTTEISVYNILGEKVADLFRGSLKAGIYKFTWNAASLPSGIYFCNMRSAACSKTVKMILAK